MTDQLRAGSRGHSVAHTNYTVRVASFAYCFVVIGLVFWERKAGALAWGLLALQFLVYPQLAFLRAVAARDSRRAEIGNLYVDSLALGGWVAMLGFPTWIAYAALFSTTLNSAIMRGWIGAICAAVCFAGGALAWIAPMGFTHYPGTSNLVSALCFFGALAYSAGVGLVVQNQNRRLRRAREEMREGERRYRLITEHAGDLVAMVDRDGRWRYTSPSYGRILSAQDLAPGGDAFRRLHEDDQIRVRGALQELMRSGVSCRLRMRLHTRHGEVRRIESLVHAVRDEDGALSGAEPRLSGAEPRITGAEPRITGAVMASRDITELREREEQLEVAGLAFERMAEAMMITSASGRILTINRSFTRITGYAPPEVLGQQESKFRSGMQDASFYDDMYATVLRSGHWRGTTWCQRRDGTVYREWRSVSAVRDADDRVTHYVTLFGEIDGLAADRPGEAQLPERPARSA
jgi:PAS domain S-box-containing protein